MKTPEKTEFWSWETLESTKFKIPSDNIWRELIVRYFKEEHPENNLSGRIVTIEGICTVSKWRQPWKSPFGRLGEVLGRIIVETDNDDMKPGTNEENFVSDKSISDTTEEITIIELILMVDACWFSRFFGKSRGPDSEIIKLMELSVFIPDAQFEFNSIVEGIFIS